VTITREVKEQKTRGLLEDSTIHSETELDIQDYRQPQMSKNNKAEIKETFRKV